MAREVSSTAKEERKTLSDIKSIVAALEIYPSADDLSIGVQINNPLSFLLEILKTFNVTEEDLIKWLVNFIKWGLPVVELGVKGILLSNLKNLISCSVDPRIPAYAREDGLYFDMSQIDALGMLNSSPLDKNGSQKYFGLTETITDENGKDITIFKVDSPYELLRPKDFNAYLWYIVHKGKYPMYNVISEDTTYQEYFNDNYNGTTSSGTIFDITEISYLQESEGINVGNLFKQEKISGFTLCSKSEYNSNGDIIHNTLMPIGSDNFATNYYINRPTFFNFLDPTGKKDETNARDFNKDIPLCRFSFCDIDTIDGDKDYLYLKNKLKVQILPKPLIHVPHIGQTQLLPKAILFDKEGKPDTNGRFSVNCLNSCTSNGPISELREKLHSLVTEDKIDGYFKKDDENNTWDYNYGGGTIKINRDGSYNVFDKKNEDKVDPQYLVECYPNLTLFEFNYDYIMSMRLYDPKVVATELINQLYNLKLGIQLNVSNVEYEGTERIIKIVKKTMESDGYESSDCFFSFSNSEYDRMSYDAELKRASLTPFGDTNINNTVNNDELNRLLNEFGDAATLEESIDKFTNIFNEISGVIVNEGSDPYDKQKVRFNLIQNFIETLVLIIINTLLTPKVVLMILINKELCGNKSSRNLSIEELLNEMMGIITEIIQEIFELIIKELFQFVVKELTDLLKILAEEIIIEQVEKFRRLIRKLLEECWFSFGRKALLPTKLDNVNYADIDITQEQPLSNEKC